ncbi:hypothetical protein SLA2020_104850 [Shorea laevis]
MGMGRGSPPPWGSVAIPNLHLPISPLKRSIAIDPDLAPAHFSDYILNLLKLQEEVLAMIRTSPYEQLDLARKITSMAIASRVSNLEAEMGKMRQKVYEKDRIIYGLEEKVSPLQ